MARLAKAVDEFVAEHKDDGARAFIVLLAENNNANQKVLTTLAEEDDISIPLTLPANGRDPGGFRLNKDVPLTVLCYRGKKVTANFAFGDPPDEVAAQEKQIADVIAAAEALLK
ncbi:MAG: hypothetical protein ACODAJ_09400 [Planctomycetota bacterium]